MMPTTDHFAILILSNAVSEQTPDLERISENAVQDEVDAVAEALQQLGHPIRHVAIRRPLDLIHILSTETYELVFNLCEGLDGNSVFESHIASLLELLGIPFSGSNSQTLALARNKNLTKKILRSSGIRTPEWICCHALPCLLPENLQFPLICKPACEDASLGIMTDAVARDLPSLTRNLEKLLPKFSREGILIEEFISGREFNVALLPEITGIHVLQPAEIDFSGMKPGTEKIVSYPAKWIENDDACCNTHSHCPANLPLSLKQALQETALAVHQALNANSYGRVDIRVDAQGRIFVLEYNPNPDITPGAGFSKALQAEKISYREFLQKVIHEALSRNQRDFQR